jgi:hypothetical protein
MRGFFVDLTNFGNGRSRFVLMVNMVSHWKIHGHHNKKYCHCPLIIISEFCQGKNQFRLLRDYLSDFLENPCMLIEKREMGNHSIFRFLLFRGFIRLRRRPRPWPWRNVLMRDIPFQQSIYHASADFAHRRVWFWGTTVLPVALHGRSHFGWP